MLEEKYPHERDGKKNGRYTTVTRLLDKLCPLPQPNEFTKTQMIKGTQLHNDIENHYNGKKYLYPTVEFIQFKKFADYALNVLELEPYRTEWCVYDEDFNLSGTIDMLFRKKNDPFIFYLYDWKRSKQVCTDQIYRYSAQLNLYRTILERKYNIKVNKSFLVLFHPNNENYLIHHIPEKKVTKFLNYSVELAYGFDHNKTKTKSYITKGSGMNKTKKHKLNKTVGGNITENERLLNLMLSLLLSLGFNVDESRIIYNHIKHRIESGTSIDIRNVMEFINFTFSINQDLTTTQDVVQIFDFERKPIQIIEGVGRKPSLSQRKDFIIQIKSYLTIDFTELKLLMDLIGFSIQEQNWITTRLELIHNTNDGPISINKVISKIKTMILTIGTEVRRSFIEIVSVYDHYESFK